MKRIVTLIAVLAITFGTFAANNPKKGDLPCGKYVAEVIRLNGSGATQSLQSVIDGYNAAKDAKTGENKVIETKASVETVGELDVEYIKWLNDDSIDKRTKIVIEDKQITILSGMNDKEVLTFKNAKYKKGVWEMTAENGEKLTLKEEKGALILHTDYLDYRLTKE